MRYLVLVADPDPPSVKLSSLVLRAAGMQVWTAATLDEAHRALVEQRPDAVLVALDLPPDGGLALARTVGAELVGRVPIIALSTQDGGDTARAAAAAGCVGVIDKPIDVTRFAAQVRALIRAAADAPRSGSGA